MMAPTVLAAGGGPKLATGARIQLTCERLALGGKGVCFQPGSGFVVLCNRALPGEQLVADITTVHKGYAEAVKVASVAPHRNAVPAPCPHFGPCGGCTLQSLAYAGQLAEKQNQVLQTLSRVGKLQGVEALMQPILGCAAGPTAGTAKPAGTPAGQPAGPAGPSAGPAGPAAGAPTGSAGPASSTAGTPAGTPAGPTAGTPAGPAGPSAGPPQDQLPQVVSLPQTRAQAATANSQQQPQQPPLEPAFVLQPPAGAVEAASLQLQPTPKGLFGFRNKLLFTWSSWCWEPGAEGGLAHDNGASGSSGAGAGTSGTSGASRAGAGTVADAMAGVQGGAGDGASAGIQGGASSVAGTTATESALTQVSLSGSAANGDASLGGGRVVLRPTLGFLRPGSQDHVLPITSCALGSPTASAIMRAVSEAVSKAGLLPANDPSGRGVMQHLVVRRAAHAWHDAAATDTQQGGGSGGHVGPDWAGEELVGGGYDGSYDGRYLVTLATSPGASKQALQQIALQLVKEVPEVAGVLHKVLPAPVRKHQQQQQPQQPVNAAVTAAVAGSGGAGNRRRAGGKGRAAGSSQQLQHARQGRDGLQTGASSSSGSGGGEGSGADGDDGSWSRAGSGGDGVEGGVSSSPSSSSRSEVLVGTGHLVERLGGLRFRVAADSFFQTNTAQAEVLYGAVSRAAGLRPSDTLLDLYCGTGSIGLTLASHCRHVLGYEAVESAVIDARFNARMNGITNASFVCGDLEGGLAQPQQEQAGGGAAVSSLPSSPAAAAVWRRPNVVVVNPARAGLSTAVILYLRQCGARRVVYVSCNPATQARDLALLCNSNNTRAAVPSAFTTRASKGSSVARSTKSSRTTPVVGRFRLVSCQPVDMFPHTDHVENVAVLDLEVA